MEVVLFEPEIPQNTGNIARTCVATGARLTLIEPLGFSLSERQMRRAGLDYWDHLDLQILPELLPYLEASTRPFYLFTTKATTPYWEVNYTGEELLIFGPESRGLPTSLLGQWPDRCLTIPQSNQVRSLNLSNAVAIALYEAMRQSFNINNL